MIITGHKIVRTKDSFLFKTDFDDSDIYRKVDSRVDWCNDSKTIRKKTKKQGSYPGEIRLPDIVFETDVFCINVPEILNLEHPITIWIIPVYTANGGNIDFLIRKYHLPPMQITLSYRELSEMFDIGISDALTNLLNKIPYTVDPIQMLENGIS